MLVNEFLEQSAKRFSDKTALVCEDQRLTLHMKNFMVPKYVEIRDELPKSSHGKIAQKELR